MTSVTRTCLCGGPDSVDVLIEHVVRQIEINGVFVEGIAQALVERIGPCNAERDERGVWRGEGNKSVKQISWLGWQ